MEWVEKGIFSVFNLSPHVDLKTLGFTLFCPLCVGSGIFFFTKKAW